MKRSFAFAFLAFMGVAIAQPIGTASVENLVEKLAPTEGPRTRSMRNLKVEPKSIDLVVQFDFDSARLQDSAKPLLDNLASAMKNDRLMSMRFSVEGHTDAKGTEAYNVNLSQKRAASVVQYLISSGVSKDRLESEGKGYSQLLFPDRPEAMENRRVRITTLN
jgi:outer membrane protein OmpA-like peptidoglycan-associated protein